MSRIQALYQLILERAIRETVDHFYPELADRNEPRAWAEQGASDIWQRAGVRVREILNTHHPDYLAPGIDEKIRDNFNILLDC